MGKFEGILICSDLDGTFSKGGSTIEINSKAVKYFTDNGGKFTFATGRTANHMRSPEFFNVFNAPVCLFNGGIVYDYKSERILYERRLGMNVQEFVNIMYEQKDIIKSLHIYYHISEDDIGFSDITSIPEHVCAIKPIKIICVFETAEMADEFKSFAMKQEPLSCCYISKSWSTGVEFNACNATKGDALDFIKNHLGNINTTIGIGDYENDISLIRHADIGVAVGDAIEEVKQEADLIVKNCNEYAIKDLIDTLSLYSADVILKS